MNIEEIRKNKPEGATHYDPRGGWSIYYKVKNDVVLFWANERKEWIKSSLTIFTMNYLCKF